MGLLRRALGLAVGAALAATAWAHGYLVEPVARNVGASDCPHCLSGGGVGEVYAGGLRWPAGKFGVCGDPLKGDKAGYHMGGGEFERKVGIRITRYRAGAVVPVTAKLTANHWGYFEYFLCKLPDSSAGGKDEARYLTNACFKTRLPVQQDGAWGDRFYVGDTTGDLDMKVRLPNMECKRCVVRWLYTSGNSCTAPGTPKKWAVPNLRTCGEDGANPEIFLNCADVALLKDGPDQPQTSRLKPAQAEGDRDGSEPAPEDPEPAPPPPEEDPEPEHEHEPALPVPVPVAASRRAPPSIPLQPSEALVSVAVAGALGMPLLLVSPALGIAGGMLTCMALLLLFVLKNLAAGKKA